MPDLVDVIEISDSSDDDLIVTSIRKSGTEQIERRANLGHLQPEPTTTTIGHGEICRLGDEGSTDRIAVVAAAESTVKAPTIVDVEQRQEDVIVLKDQLNAIIDSGNDPFTDGQVAQLQRSLQSIATLDIEPRALLDADLTGVLLNLCEAVLIRDDHQQIGQGLDKALQCLERREQEARDHLYAASIEASLSNRAEDDDGLHGGGSSDPAIASPSSRTKPSTHYRGGNTAGQTFEPPNQSVQSDSSVVAQDSSGRQAVNVLQDNAKSSDSPEASRIIHLRPPIDRSNVAPLAEPSPRATLLLASEHVEAQLDKSADEELPDVPSRTVSPDPSPLSEAERYGESKAVTSAPLQRTRPTGAAAVKLSHYKDQIVSDLACVEKALLKVQQRTVKAQIGITSASARIPDMHKRRLQLEREKLEVARGLGNADPVLRLKASARRVSMTTVMDEIRSLTESITEQAGLARKYQLKRIRFCREANQLSSEKAQLQRELENLEKEADAPAILGTDTGLLPGDDVQMSDGGEDDDDIDDGASVRSSSESEASSSKLGLDEGDRTDADSYLSHKSLDHGLSKGVISPFTGVINNTSMVFDSARQAEELDREIARLQCYRERLIRDSPEAARPARTRTTGLSGSPGTFRVPGREVLKRKQPSPSAQITFADGSIVGEHSRSGYESGDDAPSRKRFASEEQRTIPPTRTLVLRPAPGTHIGPTEEEESNIVSSMPLEDPFTDSPMTTTAVSSDRDRSPSFGLDDIESSQDRTLVTKMMELVWDVDVHSCHEILRKVSGNLQDAIQTLLDVKEIFDSQTGSPGRSLGPSKEGFRAFFVTLPDNLQGFIQGSALGLVA
ncbi:uncharacterized protein AB675_7993 [Cyphellophora attinorum]|uniref:Uncharacterized protein n=1 Tax=Cyphellophora attinorum TaxID=1664694 RepID=A0A0N1HVH3_9EURO|nr:uncharacterized protein AB675_7993 [Phialophora attinorum]KPI41287.1 hypothetical protein AB675_7993 [Phialophora attinorum]